MKTTLVRIALAFLLPIAAHAALWNGGSSTTDLWSDGANWGGTAATTGDIIQFGGTTRLSPNLDANLSVNRIAFMSGAGSFNLGGTGVITLLYNGTGSNSGVTNNSSNFQKVSNNIILGQGTNYDIALYANTADLEIAGDIALGTTRLIINATSTRTLTLSGNISGAGRGATGAVNINVDSTLVLSGCNTFTGALCLYRGTTILRSNGGLGQGTVLLGNTPASASLFIDGTYSTDRDITFNNNSPAGGSVITVGGMNAFTSAYNGNFLVYNNGTNGASRIIQLSADQGGRVNINGNITTGGQPGTNYSTYNKVGAGIVNLAGTANNYNGNTNVNEGTLLVTGSLGTAAAGNGGITVNAAATLGGNGTIARDITVKSGATLLAGNGDSTLGTLSLTGNLTLESTATLAFTLNADGSHSALDLTGITNLNLPSNLTISFTAIGDIAPSTPFANLVTGLDPATDTTGWRVTGVDGALSLVGGSLLFTAAAPIPEPATYALILASLALLTFLLRRRKG